MIIFFLFLFFLFPQKILALECSNGATFSQPGTNNWCCYNGTKYQSGELLKELTFACVDGQWLYSGHLGATNPATWAQDTQICKKYGNFTSSSTGWFGPYAYTNNDYSSRDKYLMDGSAINIYCGENKYCDSNQNCVACTGTDNPCVGQTQSQKNVFGVYFYWYDSGQDNNNYKICGPTYNSSYGYYSCSDPAKINQCSQKSTLEQTPIFGENNNMKWNNKDMYKADFIRMKRAGIDTGILVGWPQEPYDTAALPIMNQALDELKSEGQEFPKFVLFEALDNWIYKLFPEINFNDVNSRKTLINKMATRDIAIWSGLKDEYQYTKDGKKILWFFRPPEIYNSKINCQFFDEFKQELTTRGYNTFFVGPSSLGNCNSIDAYHNWGQGNVTRADQKYATAPDKFVSPKIDVCEVSPGLERENAKACAGGYKTFENFPLLARGDGTDYKKSWDYCLNNNEGWIVVQTWNEYFESTNIAPSTRSFPPATSDPFLMVKINRDKVNAFKNESKSWQECQIDAECKINGIQKQCQNHICVTSTKPGDYNNDNKVDLADFAIWKTKYLAGQATLVDFVTWKNAYLLH